MQTMEQHKLYLKDGNLFEVWWERDGSLRMDVLNYQGWCHSYNLGRPGPEQRTYELLERGYSLARAEAYC